MNNRVNDEIVLEIIEKEILWRDEEILYWAKQKTNDVPNQIITYNIGLLAFDGIIIATQEISSTTLLLIILSTASSVVCILLLSIFRNKVIHENIKYLNKQKAIYISARNDIAEGSLSEKIYPQFKDQNIKLKDDFSITQYIWDKVYFIANILFYISILLLVLGIGFHAYNKMDSSAPMTGSTNIEIISYPINYQSTI